MTVLDQIIKRQLRKDEKWEVADTWKNEGRPESWVYSQRSNAAHAPAA
jgi:hypothetical protein